MAKRFCVVKKQKTKVACIPAAVNSLFGAVSYECIAFHQMKHAVMRDISKIRRTFAHSLQNATL